MDDRHTVARLAIGSWLGLAAFILLIALPHVPFLHGHQVLTAREARPNEEQLWACQRFSECGMVARENEKILGDLCTHEAHSESQEFTIAVVLENR